MQKSWDKWMRVEAVRRRSTGTNVPELMRDEVINLDHVAHIAPYLRGTVFHLAGGDTIETTTDFEAACAALMLSQGPRPPLSIDEVMRVEA